MAHTLVTLLVTLSEAEHESTSTPYFIGAGVFTFLLLLLGILVAFGGGREHS